MTYTKRKNKIVIVNRRRFILFLVGAMILINLLVFGFVIPNSIKADTEAASATVVVQSGDTLWSIAKEYCSNQKDIRKYVYIIKKTNNLKSSQVSVGDKLRVPIF